MVYEDLNSSDVTTSKEELLRELDIADGEKSNWQKKKHFAAAAGEKK